MDIVISGASGLVGRSLSSYLKKNGHNIKQLVRKKTNDENEIYWNLEKSEIEIEKLENLDVIIHLAGENIAGKNPIQGRWTESRKNEILNSRIKGTTLLSESLNKLKNPPKVFISASAIGFYGSRGSEELTETSSKGLGFLADLCEKWENIPHEILKNKNIRIVNTRFGIILSKEGGALQAMLLPFKMGVGGILGNGKQYMSWIDIDDVIGSINHIINSNISGKVNIVSPNPVDNYNYTKTLGKVLNRPTIFPVPALAINTVFGEMGIELLLSSQKVLPKVLIESGYNFIYPKLEESLKHTI
ncbi:MAG: TIGR01777 family oxidoreductase [Candidatus Sericytochromatia bacterium]